LAWVAVLGAVTVVLWRDVRILEARIAPGGSLVANGIEIGAPAPRVVRALRSHTVVFLTDACEACFAVAADLDRAPEGVTVVVGASGGDGDALLATLPAALPTVTGDQARDWERAFDVRVAPFAVHVEEGLVTGKGHLRGPADLDRVRETA
jgi:hypothetical protein